MKIAIIEKGHYEVCYTLLKLFGDQDDITVFIDRDSHEFLKGMLKEDTNKIKWIIQEKNEPNSFFIRAVFKIIHQNAFDLCYASTLSDNFHLYAAGFRGRGSMKSVMTLHNINNFFSMPGTFNLRTLGRWWGKRQLIKQLDALTVLSPTLLPEARKKTPHDFPVFFIPGSIFDADSYVAPLYKPGWPVRITIPGSVDERRRDYKFVFEFLRLVASQNVPVHITLLGAFINKFSKNTRIECERYLQNNTNLTIFEDAVKPEVFDAVIEQSHFIWAPLHQTSAIHDGIEEKYGTTTSSGLIADIVRHARPFFAPSFLSVDPLLRKSGVFYMSTTFLTDYLNQLTSLKYDQLVKASLNFSNLYRAETVKSNFISPFRNWVKSEK